MLRKHFKSPDAILSITGKGEIVDVVLTLKNLHLAGGALLCDIDALEQDEPILSGPVSLFIDPMGRQVTPGLIARVRWQTRHRTRRRLAVLD